MSKHVKTRTVNVSDKLTYRLEVENGKYYISISEDDKSLGCQKSDKIEIRVKRAKGVKRIFKILYKNGVYPCHLRDIVNDLLC